MVNPSSPYGVQVNSLEKFYRLMKNELERKISTRFISFSCRLGLFFLGLGLTSFPLTCPISPLTA